MLTVLLLLEGAGDVLASEGFEPGEGAGLGGVVVGRGGARGIFGGGVGGRGGSGGFGERDAEDGGRGEAGLAGAAGDAGVGERSSSV